VRAAAAVLVAGLAAWHVRFLAFVCDDAFISFRYAKNFVAGLGLVFNRDERVEGYTNFLWVMVSAAVLKLGGAPEVWAPRLGALCAIAALVLWVIQLERRAPWCGVIAGALLAASPIFAGWATGGLETGLFTLLVSVAFLAALSIRERGAMRSVWANASALAPMTRPDGLLFGAATGILLAIDVLRRRLPASRLVVWSAVFLATYGAYFAWRFWYYGHLLPNTFAVKAGGGSMLHAGLEYLALAEGRYHFELPLLAGPALLALREPAGLSRRELSVWAAFVIPFLVYVAVMGGDFMDLFRFLAPLMPLFAWLAAILLTALAGAMERRFARGLGVATVLLVIGAWSFLNLRDSIESTRASNRGGLDSIGLMREYSADWARVGRFFASGTDPADTIATTAAGIIPYYCGLYTIDELGLVAPDLSRYRRLPARRPGHDLMIKGSALIELRPHFILGHPRVVASASELRSDVSIEPGWGSAVGRFYQPAGIRVSEDPPRYVGFLARKDILPPRR